MKRRSFFTRFWALAAIATLVFSQVALAAFACPAVAPQAMQSEEMAAQEGCYEANPGTRHLCMKTCQDEPQKQEVPSLAAMPAALDTGLRIEMPAGQRLSGRVCGDAALNRATSPPLPILFARFLK